MRQKILYFICFIFFSFTKEKHIVIKNKNSKRVVEIDNDILPYLISNLTIKDYYEEIYAFNPESCKRRDVYPGFESCYMRLKHEEDWYYFCGRVNEEEIKQKNFYDLFISKLKNYNESIHELKIDCFSQKKNFIKIYWIILLFAFLI